MLIMDDLERELGPLEDLEDDGVSDSSTIRRKKSKLPVVNPMCVGELYSTYTQSCFGNS